MHPLARSVPLILSIPSKTLLGSLQLLNVNPQGHYLCCLVIGRFLADRRTHARLLVPGRVLWAICQQMCAGPTDVAESSRSSSLSLLLREPGSCVGGGCPLSSGRGDNSGSCGRGRGRGLCPLTCPEGRLSILQFLVCCIESKRSAFVR